MRVGLQARQSSSIGRLQWVFPSRRSHAKDTIHSSWRRHIVLLIPSDVASLATAAWITASIVGAPGIGIFGASLAVALWIGVLGAFGLYGAHTRPSGEETRRILAACGVGTVAVVVTAFGSSVRLQPTAIGTLFSVSAALELGTRTMWARLWERRRRSGALRYRALVVGTGREPQQAASLLRGTGSEYEVIGFVTLDGQPNGNGHVEGSGGRPVLGNVGTLPHTLRKEAADCVVVPAAAVGLAEMAPILSAARQAAVDVKVLAPVPSVRHSRISLHPVGDSYAISVAAPRLTRAQATVKRALDIGIAAFALLVSLPALAAIAGTIALTSPGPILFRQERVTKGMRVFTMYKFRTMRVDADRVLETNGIDPTAPYFKLSDDPRLTRVGRLMRNLSLDELPQLWNVLKGEMSLVGPRPLPVEQVQANEELLAARHEVLAGMTGWWQIQGRSDITAEDAVMLDLFYVENWSLGLDLEILWKTFGAVLSRRGAH